MHFVLVNILVLLEMLSLKCVCLLLWCSKSEKYNLNS